MNLSAGRTATVVVCRVDQSRALSPCELFLKIQLDGRDVQIPWLPLVESIVTPATVQHEGLEIHFTADDRYFLDSAGWDLLLSYGVVPGRWQP